MSNEKVDYYILFYNYTQGLELYDMLKNKKIISKIAPTPHAINGELSCGMSLLVSDEYIDAAKKCIHDENAKIYTIVEMKSQINPRRNKFC